jgi:GNAT superfamily N-acetyltransferase
VVETTFIDKKEDFPAELDSPKLAEFLHGSLKPFEDPVPEILAGIEYALSPNDRRGGFIALARENGVLVGALVMLFTHMEGYVPPNLLLFVAVSPSMRGKGVGGRLIRESIARCRGPVKLHVEYDNPAKRLYERLGFESKYAEMRHE